MVDGLANPTPRTTLDEIVARTGQLPADQAMAGMIGVAHQVARLHAARRLHRALDESNVELRDDGEFRLREPPDIVVLEEDSSIECCPPEFPLDGSRRIPATWDELEKLLAAANMQMEPARIDVYQLGAMLCRLTTGKSVATYLSRPLAKSHLPANLQQVVDCALGFDPGTRFRAVDPFIAGLESCLAIANDIVAKSTDATCAATEAGDSTKRSELCRNEPRDKTLPF